VLKKGLYLFGRVLAGLMWVCTMVGLLVAYGGAGTPGASVQPLTLYIVLMLAVAAGTVAHELGHLLACLAVGAEVKAFELGNGRAGIRFRVRGVQVLLGWPYGGRVRYEGAPSVGRRMVITLAGSLTDVALAGLVLTSLATAPSGMGSRPLVVAIALGIGVPGLANLMPFRTRSGRLSDGARLFELRSDVRAAEAVDLQKTTARLLKSGRAAELLKLHAGLEVPAGRMNVRQAAACTMFEFNVALLPGLPDADASLAERRLTSLVRDHELGPAEPLASLTLALLRLRAGGLANHATAEQFCDQALAGKDVRDYVRRMALAAIIVSRQARGLPYEDVLATAAATLKTAGHGPEAIAAGLKAIIDPEGFLDAFRAGAPDTRLGVGSLAMMLRRQGRIGELLELHKGFGVPEGRYAAAQASSLHEVEYNLLLVPGVPGEVIDEVAHPGAGAAKAREARGGRAVVRAGTGRRLRPGCPRHNARDDRPGPTRARPAA
jgi:hypothetical protein